MRPDRLRRWPLLSRAALVGAVLGVEAFAAGSLILYEAGGVLAATGGLVATFAAALAAGLWAGAPAARGERPPTARWLFAGVAAGVAGAFATVWTLRGGEQWGEPGRALALLLLVGVPVYALGLLLPPLVAWEAGAFPAEEGDPAYGPLGTAVVGVLGGLAVGAAVTGLAFLPAVSPGPLLLGAGALLTFPLFFPRGRGADVDEEVIHEAETPYGTLRVTETVFPGARQPERRLYQNDEVESGELVRSGAPTFGYIAAAEQLFAELPRAGAYLFLGGGAYTLPRRVAERDPGARITVVELDPEVTAAAYRFFGVRPEHGIVTLHGDARLVAETLPEGALDRVFVDVYDGLETVPHHLVTAEALAGLRRLVRPGGVVVLNVIGVAKGEGERRFWSTVRTAAEAFPSLALYYHLGRDFPERQNFLLAAAAEEGFRFPVRAGAFDQWPEGEWPDLSSAAVFHDRLPAREDRRAVPGQPAPQSPPSVSRPAAQVQPGD
ncbi:MAG TPA: fused MFS/spermidine synthase [Longimicrobiaceae bacterium]|nr:fused MFS/spermidine synthase [Longimicrobiaceae bacterium]